MVLLYKLWCYFIYSILIFPPPVFDRLQYAKTEGEGLSCAWCQVDVRIDRRGQWPIVITHKLCIDQPRVYRTMNCIYTVFWMLQSQVLGQNITRRISRFFVRHYPPPFCLPSRLPDVTHVTLSPRPSLSVFAHCKQSKTGGGNGLGTRLIHFIARSLYCLWRY